MSTDAVRGGECRVPSAVRGAPCRVQRAGCECEVPGAECRVRTVPGAQVPGTERDEPELLCMSLLSIAKQPPEH